jgi:type IV secretory pathway TrbD component
MKKRKIDWILISRIIIGIFFIASAFSYHDWMPAIFGMVIIIMGIVAAVTKTGCGYTNCFVPERKSYDRRKKTL